MDIQSHVSVFASVFRRACNIDLVHADLADTFTAQIFKTQTRTPDMALRQTGQAVGLVHFQDIALEHRIVRIALHFNTMVGENMAVVFDVLAQFQTLWVF